MVVEARRDYYERGLCGQQFLNEQNVQLVREEIISYSEDNKMPVNNCGIVLTWDGRVAERHQEVTYELSHDRLQIYLIENLWDRSGCLESLY